VNPIPLASTLLLALFAGILACTELGRRYGLRRIAADPEAALRGTGPVDGAIFALLGLMIAFTFSSAASRFEGRRELVREEANDIGTAWLRLDLLGEPQHSELRELFRQYLDSRLETYRHADDVEVAMAEYRRSEAIQGRIWTLAVEACRSQSSEAASRLLLPALNEMFDIANTRRAASLMHQPPIVFAMLGLLSLLGSVVAGFSLASGRGRDWLHLVIFALITTLTVYVIVDLEYPRLGLIRVDEIDQLLVDVRAGMK
jgi:hypothetical protein